MRLSTQLSARRVPARCLVAMLDYTFVLGFSNINVTSSTSLTVDVTVDPGLRPEAEGCP